MTVANWIAVASILTVYALAAFGFIRSLDRRVGAIESRCENHQKTIDSITSLNEKVDKVFNDNEVFWRVIGPHLENVIHSPKSVDRDELVHKLTIGTISREELPVLIGLLQLAIGKSEWSNEKKLAGAWLLGRAFQLLNEPEFDRRKEQRTA